MNTDDIVAHPKFQALKERFEASFVRGDPEACWEWQGGYFPNVKRPHARRGWFAFNSQKFIAARLSYSIYRGAIGKLHVCHTCDNPACVNPAHLFLGTRTDNMQDMASKLRSRRKLTPLEVLEIRASAANSRALAPVYGVAYSTIDKLRARETWAWL
jgi:hypothetical protein